MKSNRSNGIFTLQKTENNAFSKTKFGLASEDQEEVDLYNHYQKNIYSE